VSQHTLEHQDEERGHHPTDRDYVVIALILGAITAAEVSISYMHVGKVLVPALIIMMIAKFSIVAGYFMHLKFDSSLFTKVFVAGLVLAVGVYIVAVTSLHVWVK
jgi:cytochrome c oxidase subunit 4